MVLAPAELLARIESGRPPFVLDVRSRREYVRGHVPGAIHVPFWRVRSVMPSLAVKIDEPLVVYCAHGPRARIAGAALRRLGFMRIAYLSGHITRWRREGLPEEGG